MRNYYILLAIMMLFSTGCTSKQHPESMKQPKQMTNPVNYETPGEQKNRLGIREPNLGEQGGYPQSDLELLKNTNENGNYSDAFTNELSVRVSNHLSKRKDVKLAQIAMTKDHIFVSVLLGDHPAANIKDIIAQEVQKIVPDKQIIVYTDAKHWDEMNEINRRP